MSNNVNTELLEEAASYIDDASLNGTNLDLAMEADIERQDFDSLWEHVLQARNLLRDE